MCGIVGYVGRQDALPILFAGLHRLEYRGYDSAGVAVVTRGGLKVHKAAGKVRQVEATVGRRLKGGLGVAHTRWATHGEPNDVNAHPHVDCTGNIAVVHNGIIENAAALRAELEGKGHVFRSATDTEVLAHLIEAIGGELDQAVRQALMVIDGTYGIAVIDARQPDRIVAARNGSPVVLGVGDREMFVASDVAALVRYTEQVVYLDDREVAVLEAGGYRTSTLDDRPTDKQPLTVQWGQEAYDRGAHEHFMLKEILEQPEACERTLKGRLDLQFSTAHLGGLNLSARDLLDIKRIKILGCGSAFYAGIVGSQLIESLARIPASAEPASEFRYRNPAMDPNTLFIAVSQSGETLDTLAAVQEIRRRGGTVLGTVNVVGSAIGRECGRGIFLHAGPEVAVASTKAFTNMAVAFAMLGLLFGRVRDLSEANGRRILAGLRLLPEQISQVLAEEEAIAEVASRYADAQHMFFVGRVRGWPVAREGAQKLKEISYVHAEAYQSSELKHGPLALIDPSMPTVAVVPADELLAKHIGTIKEVTARGGPVIAVTNADLPDDLADAVIRVPRNEPELDPILLTIPLQLFAYHFAIKLGRDIDKPRNLAKSVTVE